MTNEPAAGAEEPDDNPPSMLFPDGVPELTEEEKAAIDSLDMSDTIGTEEQGIRHALRTALKYMRKAKELENTVAKLTSECYGYQENQQRIIDLHGYEGFDSIGGVCKMKAEIDRLTAELATANKTIELLQTR